MSELIRLPVEFKHRQTAHCESGVTSNLLMNAGVEVSEAMSFGIGSGIFFVHLPFVRVMGLPLTSYRSFPGGIFKKTCKRLGIPYSYQTYGDALKGRRGLDQYLASGQAVGIRSNIYWLTYIPEQFRFQFNAHNLVVYGQDSNGEYLVSDPVLDKTSLCPASALTKARFVKGMLAPKGLIYFPHTKTVTASTLSFAPAIRAGIQETVNRMLFSPLPFSGVRGIRYLGSRVSKWPKVLVDQDRLKLYVANVVRMQEEIGTGGAGFRFLYAAFLQEAALKLENETLLQASRDMTAVGNLWREFATQSAKFCKDRLNTPYSEIPELLVQIAEKEKAVYQDLRRNYLSH